MAALAAACWGQACTPRCASARAAPTLPAPPLPRRRRRAALVPRPAAAAPSVCHARRMPLPAAAAAAAAEASSASSSDTAFDWQLALALAGCAFEAYNSVEVDEGSPCLTMRSPGGTETLFVDEEFLRRKFAGLVEVTVKTAKGLPASDWWPGAKSDPYAVLNIGDSSAATKVVQQSLSPEWGETFYLFARDLATQRLTVRVLDEDVGKSDDLLGTAMRGLQDLAEGEGLDVELPLRGTKGAAGSIALRLRFLPFGQDGLAEEAAAQSMGGPVVGSPPAAILSSEWRGLQKDVLESAADAMFDPVAFIDNPDTDTQAWLFWNPGARQVCLSFRGTEQVKWKDILTDLSLVPTSLDPEGIAERAWLPRRQAQAPTGPAKLEAAVAALQGKRQELRASVAEGLRGVLARAQEASARGEEQAVWVHQGFLQAYQSVRTEVLRLLETALAGEDEPWTIYITGHSLGGALSTLCAYDCGRRSWRGVPARPQIVLYNYGSPRVGNKAFAEEFDRVVPNAWRVTNSNDAVTLVPRMLGFCHIGHKAELTADELVLTRDSSQAPGEGAAMVEVALAAAVNLPQIAEQMLAQQDGEAAVAGADGSGGSQAAKQALMSGAAVVAAAASALAGAAQQPEEGSGSAPSTAAPAPAAPPSSQDVQSMLEDEINAMNRLLDGSALNEHLEPLYLENLKAAILKLQQGSQQ